MKYTNTIVITFECDTEEKADELFTKLGNIVIYFPGIKWLGSKYNWEKK